LFPSGLVFVGPQNCVMRKLHEKGESPECIRRRLLKRGHGLAVPDQLEIKRISQRPTNQKCTEER
jgi:hypothetical protein